MRAVSNFYRPQKPRAPFSPQPDATLQRRMERRAADLEARRPIYQPHKPLAGPQALPDLSADNGIDIQLRATLLESHRQQEVARLSQAADGPTDSNLRHARAAAEEVKGFLKHGSSAQPHARVNAQESQVLVQLGHKSMRRLAREAIESKKITAQHGLWRAVNGDVKGKPVTLMKMADFANYAEAPLRVVGHADSLMAACTAYTRLVFSLPAHVQADICQVQGGHHRLVVIGRDPNSDPKDMATWGPNAVVCDAWADLCYPLSDYQEMQKPERDVKGLAGTTEHYLSGPLRVVTLYTYED